MKVIINSVGVNPEKISIIITEVEEAGAEYAEQIIKRINDGKKFSFDCLSDDDAINLADKLADAGAEVEIDEDTVLDKFFNRCSKLLDMIITWHTELYKKNKIPAIVIFVIEAILTVILLYKYWAVLFLLVLVIGIVDLYTNKRDHTDAERKDATKMFKQMGKWIVICIVILLLIKPTSLIVNRFMPGYPVRNSCLLMYSQDMTIEEAFDKTFHKAKWSSYKENGTKYVVYTGLQKNDETGKEDVWQFVFMVQGDSCVLDSIYINGMDGSWSEDMVLYSIYKRAGAIK